jgi:phosphoenolpyruvate carboxykinase (GTP)
MADYFQHWLDMGERVPHPPKIFHVNWFRKGADGKYLWPGFGENVRVLKWILERVEGRADAEETAIGFVPTRNSLTLEGLNIAPETLRELFRVDADDWEIDLADTREFFAKFGGRLPHALREEYQGLVRRFEKAMPAS